MTGTDDDVAGGPRCHHCGRVVHLNSRSCRHCGARLGARKWEQAEIYDGLDLPGAENDDFDYEEYLDREFGSGPKSGWRNWPPMRLFWWISAIITLIAFGWLALWLR